MRSRARRRYLMRRSGILTNWTMLWRRLVLGETCHHRTHDFQLLRNGLLVLQYLIHNLGTEIQLRIHMLLGSIDLPHPGKQQINTLSHVCPAIVLPLTEGIHGIEDKLELNGRFRRSRDERKRRIQGRKGQVKNKSARRHTRSQPRT